MNASRKKRLMIMAILAAIVAGPLGIVILHSEDSHNLNFKYRFWKAGWGEFHPDYIRFLNVDVEFRKGLIGKDLAEVERLFPDLHGQDEATEYQNYYSSYIDHADYQWIGESAWTIEFKNGRVKEFHLWKG